MHVYINHLKTGQEVYCQNCNTVMERFENYKNDHAFQCPVCMDVECWDE